MEKQIGNPNLTNQALRPATLEELGIERTQAHRWQTMADYCLTPGRKYES
jgi:hypothetical protein